MNFDSVIKEFILIHLGPFIGLSISCYLRVNPGFYYRYVLVQDWMG